MGLQDQIQVRWFFYIEVQTACSKRLLSRVRKLTWLLKAMKKSMVYIMPRRHVQSSCSKWYHSHPLTFSTGPTLIPVRRQERFPSRRSQRRGRGQPPGYEDSIHPYYLCKLSKALYGLNYPDLKNSPKSLFLTRRVSKLPEAKLLAPLWISNSSFSFYLGGAIRTLDRIYKRFLFLCRHLNELMWTLLSPRTISQIHIKMLTRFSFLCWFLSMKFAMLH